MRKLALALLAAALFAGCSSTIPRHAAVFSPTVPPPTPTRASHAPAASVTPADTSSWVAVAPDGAGFSIKMPGNPTSQNQQVSTPAGSFPMTNWSFVDSDKRVFSVSHLAAPKGTLSGSPEAQILDQGTTAVVSSVQGGQLTDQSDITVAGHPGRALTITTAASVFSSEFVIVGDDAYVIGLGHAAGSADDGIVAAFFASFQLTA